MNTEFRSFPALTTERLTLRQLQLSDADELLALRSDERVNKYLDRPPTRSKEDAETFINKIDQLVRAGDGFYWAICLKDSPQLIGTACYWNLIPEKNMADIGYELLPGEQGKGLMQEAIKEVIRFGFEKIGLKTIAALTHSDNEPSAKVLEKNGFELDEAFKYVSIEDAEGQAVYILTKE